MSVLSYLADTNAVSDYFRPVTPVRDWFARHKGMVSISAITLAEIRRGIEIKPHSKARNKLQTFFDCVMEDYINTIYPFDEFAAVEWGSLMAQHPNLGHADSQIAAIAKSCGLIVVTRNTAHFPTCDTVNPWTD